MKKIFILLMLIASYTSFSQVLNSRGVPSSNVQALNKQPFMWDSIAGRWNPNYLDSVGIAQGGISYGDLSPATQDSIRTRVANGLKISNDSLKLGGTITENTVISNNGTNTLEINGLDGARFYNNFTSIIGKPSATSYSFLDTAFHEQLRLNGATTGHNATGMGYMQTLTKGTWHTRAQLRGGALEVLVTGNYGRTGDSIVAANNPELRFLSGPVDSVNVFGRPSIGSEMFRIRSYKHMGVATGLPINNPNAAGVISLRSVITERDPTTGALSADLQFGVMKNGINPSDGTTSFAGKFDQERDFHLLKYTSSAAVPVTATAQLVVDAAGKVGTAPISAISTYAVSGTGGTGSSSIITATGTDVTFTKVGAAEWILDVPSTTTNLLTADLFISAADNPSGTLVLNIRTLSTVFNQGNSTAKVPIIRGVTLTGGLYDSTTGVTNLVPSVVSIGSGDIQVSITNYTAVLGAGDTLLKLVF